MRDDVHGGFEAIKAREIDTNAVKTIVDQIQRAKGTRVYIAVDIDVLNPAFALATATPEAGGWSTRKLLTILEGLEGLEVIGGDVVKVSPPFVNHGETTALAAAEVVHGLTNLMAVTPVKSTRHASLLKL